MILFASDSEAALRRLATATALICLAALALAFSACQKDEGSTPLPDHQIVLNPADSAQVLVPAGYAVLGNAPDGWGNYSLPSGQDTAWVDSFYLDRYEVTNQAYAAYLNGAQAEGQIAYLSGDVYDTLGRLLVETSSADCRVFYADSIYTYLPKAGYEMTPAVMVTWYGASAFAAFYGKRLPTDQEWEKAARGGSGALGSLFGVPVGYPYPWGDEGPTPELANFGRAPGTGAPQLVDSYPQGMSWYGAFNMAGNVMEWTATSMGSTRVLRGGSFLSSPADLLNAMRFYFDPGAAFASYGFRCVSDPQ